jgi:hypothetical protein
VLGGVGSAGREPFFLSLEATCNLERETWKKLCYVYIWKNDPINTSLATHRKTYLNQKSSGTGNKTV